MKQGISGLQRCSKTYLVDTNIFLEVLLSRDRKKECKKFLISLREGKNTAIVTDFTIHSIIVIMNQPNTLNELKTFLLALTAYKGLHVHHTTIAQEIRATELAAQQNLDMDDALQYSSALAVKAEAIVSFDKHFDNLKIPRIPPKLIN